MYLAPSCKKQSKMHACWHQAIKDQVTMHFDGENDLNSNKNAGRPLAHLYPSAIKRHIVIFSLLFYEYLRRFEALFFHTFS